MFSLTEPKTAEQLIARMRETEKIELRAATTGRLAYLLNTIFAADGPPLLEEVQRAQQILRDKSTAYTVSPWWITQTWMI
jgi:hypothetical protein